MALNFNGTTPAAPAGSTNVKWQNDASGNVSAYVPSTAGVSPVDLTAQNANIPTTILLAATAGLYRVTAYIIVTATDFVSSTLPRVVITWSDKDNLNLQTVTLTPTNTGNSLTTFQQANMEVSSAASNIQYSTTGYASNTPNSMQYALHLRIEQM